MLSFKGCGSRLARWIAASLLLDQPSELAAQHLPQSDFLIPVGEVVEHGFQS